MTSLPHRPDRSPAAPLALAAMLGAGLALTGCTSPANDRFRFGEDGLMPAFETRPDSIADPTPSITSLDRSGWEPVAFLVPVHGTAHQPTYAPSEFDLNTLARQRGEYPTVETCLDLGDPHGDREAWLAARTHGTAFLDALLLVPRAVIRPPCATDWSPTENYARAAAGQDLMVVGEVPADPPEATDSDPTDGFFDEADSP